MLTVGNHGVSVKRPTDVIFIRYEYGIFGRYVYVIFMVYSDDIRLRYICGFYFSSKKLSYIPRIYLKYNVRKGMVGRSEDVRKFSG